MSRSSLTDCGLDGIRTIPYGTHMCHFYRDPASLADAVVPFIAAGLRAGERCIWVTSAPLDALAAREALRAAGVDVEAATADGSLRVQDYDGWYLSGGALDPQAVCDLWLREEREALAQGHAGLRVSGNVGFLTPETWPQFMEYERAVDAAFRKRRIVALCNYPRERCGAAEVADVVRRHSCTLDHPDEGWQLLTPGAAGA